MNSSLLIRLSQFFLIGLVLISLPLAPVNFSPRALPMPDLLFCFLIAWHLRDPQSSPIILIIFLTLLADIVEFRPIGLWPLFMIILSNIMLINRRLLSNGPFAKELLFFSTIFFCALMGELLFLNVTLSPTNGFGVSAQEVIVTSIAYPIMISFLHLIFRLKYKNSRSFFSEKL